MKSHPRGSAPAINAIARRIAARSRDQVDAVVHMFTQSGYPPMTEPLTLKMLLGMDDASATIALRSELERTTTIDPDTGDPIPDHATIKLVTEYIQSQQHREATP